MKYIEEFLNYLKVIKKSSVYTIESYRGDLMELYDFKVDLLSITEDDIKDYLEFLYSRNLKRNSISRKLSSIRSFYQYLYREGYVKENLFREISNPRGGSYLPKYAKDQDLEKLFHCFNLEDPFGQRNTLILEMLYATGVRVGELVNIRLSDINFDDRSIRIFGKGRKWRMVFYGSYCEDILKLYLRDGFKNLSKGEVEYLFLNKNGKKISSRYVGKILEQAITKCCIDYKISPHTFRHTFATDMLNAGADLMTVKELLGHSSVNTTGIYTHVSNEQLMNVYQFAHPRSRE